MIGIEEPLKVLVERMVSTHSHLREGDVVGPLIKWLALGGVDTILPMPNTNDGLTTVDQVVGYRKQVKSAAQEAQCLISFIPTVMVTEDTEIAMIDLCLRAQIWDAKIYPRDRTTKSHNGVRHYQRLLPVLKEGGRQGMRFHFHPEHPDLSIASRDAEYLFLPIIDMVLNETNAVVVWEHGTDHRCIPFWEEWAKSGRFFVTLTAHHLLSSEDSAFGDVRQVCKPPIKTELDRLALVELVSKNYPWVMAGPDDAPHSSSKKHVHQGQCACGAYTAPVIMPLYAEALEHFFQTPAGVVTFINFTSRNARALYRLPSVERDLTLVRRPQVIPTSYPVGNWLVEPFWAGREISWSVE